MESGKRSWFHGMEKPASAWPWRAWGERMDLQMVGWLKINSHFRSED